MFGLFKRKKKTPLSISEKIQKLLNQGEKNLHINLIVEDQILFQIVPAMAYGKRGVLKNELDGFIEIHFFSKNRTETIENHLIAKELERAGEFIYFEEPKGIHFYLKAIGKKPSEIEIVIEERINNMYQNIESNNILIEYSAY